MIEGLPNWVNVLFLLTVVATVVLFYYANGKRTKLLFGFILWSVLQSVLAINGFYQITDTLPPRFILVLLPAAIMMVIGLLPKYRTKLLKNRNRTLSTLLHTVRVPVEVVLFYLFIYGMVPELMTFEGRNFDIAAGLTAPIVGVLIFTKRASNKMLIAWNAFALCLVLFILFNGILSSELPFQQFGFEQPNRAINYFPFILLPAVVVPTVVYTHLSDLIALLSERTTVNHKAQILNSATPRS
ncbi:hypothetical protein [Rufibacter roseus]|uniref:Uncharacterized protein n=1 Tax=Rufibacter roseus TaxID=1567108 RepID=A0ABW2DTQ9_9BACT|nr:hypothetical protein [Rufibacter roseus]